MFRGDIQTPAGLREGASPPLSDPSETRLTSARGREHPWRPTRRHETETVNLQTPRRDRTDLLTKTL